MSRPFSLIAWVAVVAMLWVTAGSQAQAQQANANRTQAQRIASQLQRQAAAGAIRRGGTVTRVPQRGVNAQFYGGRNFNNFNRYRAGRPIYGYGYTTVPSFPDGLTYPRGGGFYGTGFYPGVYGYPTPGLYQYRIPSVRRSTTIQSNRLPGSNYFGNPHASQFFGN
ncbi:MAG: hypothetical protein AAF958_19140 [Planctomycetota bacterium]